MCGILGLFAPHGVRAEPQSFSDALARMSARGPDDSGEWRDEHVWLGHRRLAIMDPSAAGHQPMESLDGRYVLLFNGAIYNHLELRAELGSSVWRGNSDTETLLAAFSRWGTDCLSRLNGMFAFAVWDRSERKLFLARDRLGVKPLYYGWQDGQLTFASRPTAAASLLPSAGRAYNLSALRGYLECGFIPGNQSTYQALRKLPPAHYLVCSATETRQVRYWDYRHLAPQVTLGTEAELLDEFQCLFDSAVRQRLISDVPLGVFLSSGVDSALVAAAMRRVGGTSHKAFTISFSESAYDEGPMTARIAESLGMELVTERLSADDLLAALPRYLQAVDEPVADSAGIATMVLSEATRRHITVALTGDGGDELFGGYPHYGRLRALARLLRLPATLRDKVRPLLNSLPWHNGKLLAGALTMSNEVGLFHYLRSMSKDYGLLLRSEVTADTVGSCELFEQCAASMALDLDEAELGARLDMAFTLPELYLQKLDMATMAHSIEARSPFMDYRLVEWAMRLPAEHKLAGHESKSLLKKALCRSLPRELVYRPKQGFSVPIGKWLRGPLREWAQDSMRDSALTDALPIDWPRARDLLSLQLQGKRNTYPLVWALLMLLSFVRHHGHLDVSVPALPKAA